MDPGAQVIADWIVAVIKDIVTRYATFLNDSRSIFHLMSTVLQRQRKRLIIIVGPFLTFF